MPPLAYFYTIGVSLTSMFLFMLLLYYSIVRELHREFLRAGSDVMQTFTFYASDDKLANRGNSAVEIGVSLILKCYCEVDGKD